ncbi:MAG: carbon monoxide dehydrogenase subunit G [Parvibaculum sp.]|uniref:SRPBCC family protein n=1 Tax=Parvibaculum sp. TaxID=2024848 RepID=UPI001D44D8DD|nr:carbon monoxide dehydrogenase subunit G [Parvibaculum sp.]MBX3488042.1 carbon monoxide dehydrogenase subunit G [Parvibaculum sp.]MBX3495844.1 carbon monoxide dehydrogenase subunit G [Parvibaculum sp.]MCW5727979.1 carbon monoxide dehydrogenase subunit G [Parvibaculum sp.]
MEMSGEYRIPASREDVWTALNDADVLLKSIPGAESVAKIADDEFEAVAKAKVGPVSARFKGKVKLTDIDPPNGYTISGEGNGGAAGFAKGSAKVTLTEAEGGGTILAYSVSAQVGGKLAQIGQRFIDSTASKMAEEFFGNFSALAGGSKIVAPSGELPELVDEMAHGIPTKSPDRDAISPTGVPLVPDEEAGLSLSPWVWGPAVILVLVVLVWIFGL